MAKKGTDKAKRVVGLTNYLISLQPTYYSVAYTLLLSVLVGIIGYFFLEPAVGLFSMLLEGSLMGVFYLFIPALLSSFLTSVLSARTAKPLQVRRSAYLSYFATLMLSVIYVLGCFFSYINPQMLFDVLIYGYILIFASRIFILYLTYPYKLSRIIGLSFVHPLLGYLMLVLSPSLSALSPAMVLPPVTLMALVLKAIIGLSILFAGVLFFMALINAPMKRNFNVNAFQLAISFIAHWFDSSSIIEERLAAISEKTDTLVGVIAFRVKDRLKALLVVPMLHPGPFGQVGGGKMTRVLTEVLEKETGAHVIIPHGAATHDMNPTDTDSLYKVTDVVYSGLNDIRYKPSATQWVRNKDGDCNSLGMRLGDSAFVITTFSPKATEDIDPAVGIAAVNEIKHNYDGVVFSDAHNCFLPGHNTVFSGSKRVFEIIDSLRGLDQKMRRERFHKLFVGFASDPMSEYSTDDGIGPTGLRVIVFSIGGKETAYVVFDANNMAPGLREEIQHALKGEGFSDSEVVTTDSHCVNNVQGVENPLGVRITHKDLVKRAVDAAVLAREDLEEATSGATVQKVNDVMVFGPEKSAEIVSTVNSLIAIMKIVSPLIFGIALVFSLLGVLLIPW